jgi:hypothetical protein
MLHKGVRCKANTSQGVGNSESRYKHELKTVSISRSRSTHFPHFFISDIVTVLRHMQPHYCENWLTTTQINDWCPDVHENKDGAGSNLVEPCSRPNAHHGERVRSCPATRENTPGTLEQRRLWSIATSSIQPP